MAKKVQISITRDYKSYKNGSNYTFVGDLIVLSGINGSGKSQLFKIIANKPDQYVDQRGYSVYENIGRIVKQDGVIINGITIMSFKDNIKTPSDFGSSNATSLNNNRENIWNFYDKKIRGKSYLNEESLILNDNSSLKSPYWRSILKLIDILKTKHGLQNFKNLTKDELFSSLPDDFVWINDDNIINQIGDLFFAYAVEMGKAKMKCGEEGVKFDKTPWIENAPWTKLNNLFKCLNLKYRFKKEYDFNITRLDENPFLKSGSNVRKINDLSDGEKAILRLAIFSLENSGNKEVKLALFDEFDATLNPSLSESFFYVLNEFYVKNGIQVIIATHSPATISLAPDNTTFYEIFQVEGSSPEIHMVNRDDYSELKEATEKYYKNILNQNDRREHLKSYQMVINKNLPLVEDKYKQIYEIAFLKINNVSINKDDDIDKLFEKNADFKLVGGFSTGHLYQVLTLPAAISDNFKTICLFDFDNEGYRKYEDLTSKKIDSNKMFEESSKDIHNGIYLKHTNFKRYALMLPIPSRLEKFISLKTSTDCFIEVESLLSEEYLKSNNKCHQRSEVLNFYMLSDSHKKDFWKDLIDADKNIFADFVPLFDTVSKIFKEE